MALGIGLRLRHLLAGRSLWGDEASIVANLMQRSFAELLLPLDNDQSAPLGWLWLQRATWLLLDGPPDLTFRLWPFLLGTAGLVALTILCARHLERGAALFCVTAAALLPTHLYFAAEAKQYASDFLVAALLLLIAFEAMAAGRACGRHLLAFLLVGLLAVPLSHPSAFVIAGVGTALVLQAVAGRRHGEAAAIAAVCALLAGLFLALYLAVYSQGGTLAAQRAFWEDRFAPPPWRSAESLYWYYKAWLQLPAAALFEGRFYGPAWIMARVLAGLLLLLGAWRIARARPLEALVLLLPPALALLASALQLYPFSGRFLLFAAPATLILVAAGLTGLRADDLPRPALAGLAALGLLAVPLAVTLLELARPDRPPFAAPDIKSPMAQIAAGRRPGDVVYVAANARGPFRVYREAYGLGGVPLVEGRGIRAGIGQVIADAERLRAAPRVWALFTTHRHDDEMAHEIDALTFALQGLGRQLMRRDFPGAALLLYARDAAAEAAE
jgi:hypothetical protein